MGIPRTLSDLLNGLNARLSRTYRDSNLIIGMVIWIAFLSTLSAGLAIWSAYYYAIDSFGNPDALDVSHPATASLVFCTCLAIVTMQAFFAYRVKVSTR